MIELHKYVCLKCGSECESPVVVPECPRCGDIDFNDERGSLRYPEAGPFLCKIKQKAVADNKMEREEVDAVKRYCRALLSYELSKYDIVEHEAHTARPDREPELEGLREAEKALHQALEQKTGV